LPTDEPGQPGSRYARAARCLADWRRAGMLRTDSQAAYYLAETEYSYANTTQRRRDLLAAVAVEPWSARVVLPHEHTMAGPKADRLRLLEATHLNASPIWLLAREQPPELARAWALADSCVPEVEFTWRDERHRLWAINDAALAQSIQEAFSEGSALYIADGHHRYETSLAFKNGNGASVPGAGAILAALTWADDPGLLVLPTHRLLS